MLKLKKGKLTWSEHDVVVMSKILDEHAAKLKMPLQMSVVRAAAKKGAQLSPKLQEKLKLAEGLVRLARGAKGREDVLDPQRAKWFPHQRVDVDTMRVLGFPAYLLGHQPGVGKTLEAIGRALDTDARRILVVCPNSAKEQWVSEIFRWDTRGPRTQVVQGSTALQIQQLSTRPLAPDYRPLWIIAHWESLVHARLGHYAHPWDLVVLDEAHNIQSRDAKRTETAWNLDATHRLALTAHPYDTATDQLFPILKFLYPEQYSSFWRFVAQHIEVTPKRFGGLELGEPSRPKLLKWELEPFMLRRTKQSVFKNLPPITRVFRHVELSRKAEREYAKLKKEFFVELAGRDKSLVIPSDLARVTRLRQYLVAPALVGGTTPSVKFPLVLELLDEMAHPPVIFTEFREAAVLLQQFLRKHKRRSAIIQGRRHMAGRTARGVGRKFLAGGYAALIVVRKAGSESLNLGGFGEGIHLDPPWGPRGLEQSEGRVDRPEEGTGRLVSSTFYPLVVKDSYETKMWKRIQDRHFNFAKVFTVSGLKEMFA